MSKALKRVIEQQQNEIDGQKSIIDGYQRQISAYEDREKELFDMFDKLCDVSINKFEFNNESDRKKYFESRQDIRLYMMEKGWCFSCGGFECECYDDEA